MPTKMELCKRIDAFLAILYIKIEDVEVIKTDNIIISVNMFISILSEFIIPRTSVWFWIVVLRFLVTLKIYINKLASFYRKYM